MGVPAKLISIEHPLREDQEFRGHADAENPTWYLVTKIDGEERWEELKRNPEIWESRRDGRAA